MKTGYEISFNRYSYKPEPMRSLAEIQADILALETQTEGLLAEIMGGMAPGPPEARARRVYVDTSVFGGCEDEEFREASRMLFELFRRGELTLVFSRTTLDELKRAPARVRMTLEAVPGEHTEFLETSADVEQLAEHYLAAGVVGRSMRDDAVHLAFATLAKTDVLVSWNLRHMVNPHRIHLVNAVNRELEHPSPRIRTPLHLLELDDDC